MVFGRTIGWAMVIISIVMASAEAVMALGASGHAGLVTADIVTLLVGEAPEFSSATWPDILSAIGTNVMAMPAWLAIGVIGLSLAHAFRTRSLRRRRSSIRPL